MAITFPYKGRLLEWSNSYSSSYSLSMNLVRGDIVVVCLMSSANAPSIGINGFTKVPTISSNGSNLTLHYKKVTEASNSLSISIAGASGSGAITYTVVRGAALYYEGNFSEAQNKSISTPLDSVTIVASEKINSPMGFKNLASGNSSWTGVTGDWSYGLSYLENTGQSFTLNADTWNAINTAGYMVLVPESKLIKLADFNRTGLGRVGSYQYWTVPRTGRYLIRTYGAQGGKTNGSSYRGGYGAIIEGDFDLIEGQRLKILVGHAGDSATGSNSGSGGGGGTFVALDNNLPLIVSGGGGGGSRAAVYSHGDGRDATGTNRGDRAGALGGTYGNGRGAGFSPNGDGGSLSFKNGGLGGTRLWDDGGDGGFGGGAGNSGHLGGGGGGYAGGSGGYFGDSNSPNGDKSEGGGSYNSGLLPVNSGLGSRAGHGLVSISYYSNYTDIESVSLNKSSVLSGEKIIVSWVLLDSYLNESFNITYRIEVKYDKVWELLEEDYQPTDHLNYEFVIPRNVGFSQAQVRVSSSYVDAIMSTWTLSNFFTIYNHHFLIRRNDDYYHYTNNGWLKTTGSDSLRTQFVNEGMSDLNHIPEIKWSELLSPFNLVSFTNSDYIPIVDITVPSYKPIYLLEEKEGNLSVKANTSKDREVSLRRIANPHGQLILPVEDIILYAPTIPWVVKKITFKGKTIGTSTDGRRIVFSVDEGMTYLSWVNGKWTEISTDVTDIDGMTIETINARTQEDWFEVFGDRPRKIRFAYFLEMDLFSNQLSIEEVTFLMDSRSSWEKVKKTDYIYGYPNDTTLQVQLLKDGRYKINY